MELDPVAPPGLLELLDDDLLIAVAEQLHLPELLSLRAASVRFRAACLRVGCIHLRRRSELSVPIFRCCFSSLRWLEVHGCKASWIPRLAATLALLPSLTWLFIHQLRESEVGAGVPGGEPMMNDTTVDALAGALHAHACPQLLQLGLDERLSEEHANRLAEALTPNAALLLGVSHTHESVLATALSRGACANATFHDGGTALTHASLHPNADLVRTLLTHGAAVNAARPDGATPLIIACNRGHMDVVLLLIDARADVNARTLDGTTALHTATYKGHTPAVIKLLEVSVWLAQSAPTRKLGRLPKPSSTSALHAPQSASFSTHRPMPMLTRPASTG